ncbi:hypothetical protein ID866_2565 [Astraeus odoratus]|nr:hypothetical protein ID866_2565 [Astraeus odoratus]
MSMSFAHNLVTSWVQSAQVGQLRSGISDAERILHEELRRPPRYVQALIKHTRMEYALCIFRLGVGAPIPAATSANRDASKLRHRLAKMDAKTASLLQTSSQPGPGSDEEEEKGRTKRRATNIDPFVMHGNKKRKKSNGSGKMVMFEPGRQRRSFTENDVGQRRRSTRYQENRPIMVGVIFNPMGCPLKYPESRYLCYLWTRVRKHR